MLTYLLLIIVLLPLWRHVTPVERASLNSRRTNPNFLNTGSVRCQVVNSTCRPYIVRDSLTTKVGALWLRTAIKGLLKTRMLKTPRIQCLSNTWSQMFSFTLWPSYPSKITANLSLYCRISEEGALCMCICMYSYICTYISYIRYIQTPIKRTPALAPMNVWQQKFPT
jgi:hypothetical protein